MASNALYVKHFNHFHFFSVFLSKNHSVIPFSHASPFVLQTIVVTLLSITLENQISWYCFLVHLPYFALNNTMAGSWWCCILWRNSPVSRSQKIGWKGLHGWSCFSIWRVSRRLMKFLRPDKMFVFVVSPSIILLGIERKYLRLKCSWNRNGTSVLRVTWGLYFDCRMGIKESVDWLVEVMERSKRTEMLRVRAAVTSPATA